MKDEPPMNDLRPIWRDQTVQDESIPAQQLRAKARKVQQRTRRDAVIEFTIALVCALIFSRLALRQQADDWFGITGWGLAAAAGIYIAVLQFRVLTTAWTRNLSSEAAANTCLDFYRSTLRQRLETMRRVTYATLPLVLSVEILIVGSVIRESRNPYFVPPLEAVVTFCLVMAFWAVWFVYSGRRGYRRIRNEIATLDALEKDVR